MKTALHPLRVSGTYVCSLGRLIVSRHELHFTQMLTKTMSTLVTLLPMRPGTSKQHASAKLSKT